MLLFDPPLLNSASPWATTEEDLQSLYDCPYTGALTIRTSLLHGFKHDGNIHQYCFFTPNHGVTDHSTDETPDTQDHSEQKIPTQEPISSLNTLGYSPIALPDYLYMVREVCEKASQRHHRKKPIIFSVAGSASEIIACYHHIAMLMTRLDTRFLMEINLSCPNIAGKPPPAYSKDQLSEYLRALNNVKIPSDPFQIFLDVGIKTPPFTYPSQFDDLISALLDSTLLGDSCPITFITATNTLGNCLIFDLGTSGTPALDSTDGSGIGGMAGVALHPLALGNVRRIRQMLDAHEELKQVDVIGVGGVADAAGFARMKSAGADAVGVGTALGNEGIGIFKKILGVGMEVAANVPTET